MRLDEKEQRIIREGAERFFGADAVVRLFGSRVADDRRGGDIDLLIATSLTSVDEVVQAEIGFRAFLQQELGERKVDVLVDYPARRERPAVFLRAEATGVRL